MKNSLRIALAPPGLADVLAEAKLRSRRQLGNELAAHLPQRLAPAHAWQAARSTGAFTLVGCTVTPGFDFAGFQLLSDDPQAQRDWPMLAQLHPELV